MKNFDFHEDQFYYRYIILIFYLYTVYRYFCSIKSEGNTWILIALTPVLIAFHRNVNTIFFLEGTSRRENSYSSP